MVAEAESMVAPVSNRAPMLSVSWASWVALRVLVPSLRSTAVKVARPAWAARYFRCRRG